MDRMQTIGDLELDPGEFLMFRYYEAPRAATMKFDTGPLSQHIAANLERPATIRRPTRPVFIDAQTEQEFVVERVPAYVGRPNSAVPEVNEQLVDLSNLKEAKTVSRPHARLVQDSKSNGYYIESVKQNNLVYVNEEAVEPGQKRNLKTGDVVRLGRVHLRYDERSL
jgi:pSer/pThr/pTyr-binding forkhead associated (FHA) protein